MAALTAKDRKKEQRRREKEALAKHGGRRITFIVYGSTNEKLNAICEKHGFTGKQKTGEALTFLIESSEL